MRPVFLLYMSRVIFVIGAAPGKGDRQFAFQEVPVKVVIKEFSAIIGLEPEEREGQVGFDLLDGLLDTGIALIPDGTVFGPTAENVRQRKAPDEVAIQ